MAENLGTVGVLDILIGGSSTLFNRAVDEGEKRLTKFGGKLGSTTQSVLLFSAAAAAAGATVFAFVKNIADVADEAGKAAQKLGMTTEAYSGLAFAAKVANVSNEEFSVGVRQMAKNMADAQAGMGDSRSAFRALGFDVEDAGKKLKPTDQALLELAEKFSRFKDGPEKTALAMKVFGRSGAELIPFLNQGRDGIEELRKEAERLGIVIGTDAAKAATEFNDNLAKMQAMAKGVAIQVGGPLVEAIGKASGAFLEATKSGKGFWSSAAEGLAVLIGGDDLYKFNQEIFYAGEQLAQAWKDLDAAKRGEKRGFFMSLLYGPTMTVEEARKQVDNAIAELKRLQAAKPFMAPGEKPKTGGTENAPALFDEKAAAASAEAAQRWEEMVQQDKLEASQALAAIDTKRGEQQVADEATFQAQRMELQQRFDDLYIQNGQAAFERRQAVKAMEYKSDADLENEAYDARLAQLQLYSDQELAIIGGRQKVEQQMEEQHQDTIRAIRGRGIKTTADYDKASYSDRARFVAGFFEDMSSATASGNRRMFELNKAAGIANVALSLPEKISDAYKWGNRIGGPIAGAAFATIAGAAGLAHIAMIKAQTFGGGGGAAPSLAGATPAAPVTPVPASSGASGGDMTTILNFTGTADERMMLRRLFKLFNEARRDGGGRFILMD